MAARAKQCSISFPGYMDRETFQREAKDGMLIRNNDFHQSTKLVSLGFQHLIVDFVL